MFNKRSGSMGSFTITYCLCCWWFLLRLRFPQCYYYDWYCIRWSLYLCCWLRPLDWTISSCTTTRSRVDFLDVHYWTIGFISCWLNVPMVCLI